MAKRQNIVCRSEVFNHLHTKSSPPPPPPHTHTHTLSTSLAKAWSGLIMKRAVTGNQRNQRIITHLAGQRYVWHGCKWKFAGPQIHLQPAKIKSQHFGVLLKFLVCN